MIVGDIMTRSVISAPAETSVAGAIALLEPMEIRHLPVTDAGGNLIGIVAERDLHSFYAPRQELAGNWVEAVQSKLEEPISRIMTEPTLVVNEDTPVAKAIEILIASHVSALPVVAGEKLVGILSFVDLLRALGKKLDA